MLAEWKAYLAWEEETLRTIKKENVEINEEQ